MEEYQFTLNMVDKEGNPIVLDCTPDNTELYTFSDRWREAEHFFRRTDPENQRMGAFVWRSALGDEEFDRLRQEVIDSQQYCIYTRPEPVESDINSFLAFNSRDVTEVPSDWNE